jgi:hypothetical protein
VESDIISHTKRIYYYAKRIAKVMVRESVDPEEYEAPINQPDQ